MRQMPAGPETPYPRLEDQPKPRWWIAVALAIACPLTHIIWIALLSDSRGQDPWRWFWYFTVPFSQYVMWEVYWSRTLWWGRVRSHLWFFAYVPVSGAVAFILASRTNEFMGFRGAIAAGFFLLWWLILPGIAAYYSGLREAALLVHKAAQKRALKMNVVANEFGSQETPEAIEARNENLHG